MDTGPRIDSYEWAGGREAMLRFGPDAGRVAVLALPLFEEANRTRAFAVSILRALAVRGIGGVLPDVPGQGESLVSLAGTTLLHQRAAIERIVEDTLASGRQCFAVGIRSGALLDTFALFSGRWHLSPQGGEELVQGLLRIAKAGGVVRRDGDLYSLMGAAEPAVIAGNAISSDMICDLQGAEVYRQPGVPQRTVVLCGGKRPADRTIDAPPPWRRAEPGNDIGLAQLLAADIADWIATCVG